MAKLPIYGLKIVSALIYFVIGLWIAGIVRRYLRKFMSKSKIDPTLISFTSSITYVTLIIFTAIAALSSLGIQTTSFIAVLGAAGLAIGLSLQGSLANFAAGVLMIIFKPFKVGDFVDVSGSAGTVQGITIFNTLMNTPDNKKIIIPNGKILADTITNFTANDTRRLDLKIGVSYSDDLEKVKNTINAVLSEDSRILKEPAPIVGVLEFADSSINIVIRPWVNRLDYWAVHFDTYQKLKQRFDQEGITIPFPQRDIHLLRDLPLD